jgi:hypothetical protein
MYIKTALKRVHPALHLKSKLKKFSYFLSIVVIKSFEASFDNMHLPPGVNLTLKGEL